MPSINPSLAERNTYRVWHSTTHLAHAPFPKALDEAVDSFVTNFHGRSNLLSNPSVSIPRVIGPSIRQLGLNNLALNCWESRFLRTLNRTTPDETDPTPFHPRAQPRYLQYRQQAISVWYSLLLFLVVNWSGYGGINSNLHRLGLDLSRELCDSVDDLHVYSTILPKGLITSEAIQWVVGLIIDTITRDPQPTPRTNPLLWWVGVLVHCDIHHETLLLPIAGIEHTLGLPSMVEALDHYARSEIFQTAYLDWEKQVIDTELHDAYIEQRQRISADRGDWVANDEETPPPNHYRGAETCLASVGFHRALRVYVDTWVRSDTVGPMREIVSIRNGVPLLARQHLHSDPPNGPTKSVFRVWFKRVDHYTLDPMILQDFDGTRLPNSYTTFNQACDAAMQTLEYGLQAGIYEDQDGIRYDHKPRRALVDMTRHGTESGKLIKFDIVSQEREQISRARVVYIDVDAESSQIADPTALPDNMKMTAWIEKEMESSI